MFVGCYRRPLVLSPTSSCGRSSSRSSPSLARPRPPQVVARAPPTSRGGTSHPSPNPSSCLLPRLSRRCRAPSTSRRYSRWWYDRDLSTSAHYHCPRHSIPLLDRLVRSRCLSSRSRSSSQIVVAARIRTPLATTSRHRPPCAWACSSCYHSAPRVPSSSLR